MPHLKGIMPGKKLTALLALVLGACAHELPSRVADRPFTFPSDRFAFANETVWNYVDGHPVTEDPSRLPREHPPYSRRCFVMARAAVQFWKFARFVPSNPPLDEKTLTERIRGVTGRAVWEAPLAPRDRVIFPGYHNLFELSRARPEVLESNLGLGWPTYFRPGNYDIVCPPTRAHQARTDTELKTALAKNTPTILWLVNFPSLSINHTVVVYACSPSPDGDRFEVYDPNDSLAPKILEYHSRDRTFSYQKTFYFVGGRVDVRPVYLSVLQ